MSQTESFHDLLVRQSAEIAERWVAGDFGARGPYTQVSLTEEQAQAIGRIAIEDGITIAEATRVLIEFALSQR